MKKKYTAPEFLVVPLSDDVLAQQSDGLNNKEPFTEGNVNPDEEFDGEFD